MQPVGKKMSKRNMSTSGVVDLQRGADDLVVVNDGEVFV